jgi:GNAT superfamily N-acetyltransferase
MLDGEWEGAPGEAWYLPGASGVPVAYYKLELPDLENLDRAPVYLYVHPEARRHGIGRKLVRHAAQRAAGSGRTMLESVVLEGSAGDVFATGLGAVLSLEEVRRVQDLRKVPPERVASLRAEAERKAPGYSLVIWEGPIPGEHAAQVARVINAFGDAPRGEGVEPEVWDADRIRERAGRLVREGHMVAYTVAAMHGATGEMAAYTEVAIDPLSPEWGYQQLTAVTRPHRGHRLGLLVKTAMMQWLASAQPSLRWIQTGNAAANDHMIAVNDALGYEVVRPGWKFYEIPVDKVT